jgi:elongation factor G
MSVDTIKKRLAGNKVVAIQYPIGAAETFEGIVDIIEMKAYHFEGDSGEKITEIDIPADIKDKCEALRLELMEKVAEQDESLMEKYFEDGELSVEEIKKGLRMGVCRNDLYAVTCGSALQNIGVQMVIDAAVEFLPSPLDVNEGNIAVKDVNTKEELKSFKIGDDTPLAAIAFKVATDPYV